MYFYKLDGDNIVHTLIADERPDGYKSFVGNTLAGADGRIDRTKIKLVNGDLQEIPQPVLPAPYIPTAAELLAQAKQEKLWQIQSELDRLDKYLPRALEDFWTTIGFDATTLPQVQQERMAQKAALREKYAAVATAGSVEDVEGVTISL